jgi:hypothetical protein
MAKPGAAGPANIDVVPVATKKTTAPAPRQTTKPPATGGAPRATAGYPQASPTASRPRGLTSGRPSVTISLVQPPLSDKTVSPPNEAPYRPPAHVRQPQADIDAVRAPYGEAANLQLSKRRNQGYRSPVTNHIYVWHEHSYYNDAVYPDVYNPYDWRNYNDPLSPWVGWESRIVVFDSCI